MTQEIEGPGRALGGAWSFPFANDPGSGTPSRRAWALLALACLALHFLALGASLVTGNFDPLPNHDHVNVMEQVLDHGFPDVAIWPPGFGYYLAAKSRALEAMGGLPWWWGKVLFDPWLTVASGLLSALLAWRLTRSTPLAMASGVGMVAVPLFALAAAEDLAVILFQPLFLAALVVFVGALQRASDVRRPDWRTVSLVMGRAAGAGVLLGAACLVRANPQFLLFALAPMVWWTLRRAGRRRPGFLAAGLVLAAVLAQALVLAPWAAHQRRLGADGAFAAPVVYYAFFDGIRRHDGFEVSEALRADPSPPPLSFQGVVDFHRYWVSKDPVALLRLYAVKAVRAWYLSDSGRWDRAIVLTHLPLWLLALAGLARWLRRRPLDPALIFVVAVILYLWAVSAAVSGLARYLAPAYGLISLLAAVALWPWFVGTGSAAVETEVDDATADR
jgi:hypothetical protein